MSKRIKKNWLVKGFVIIFCVGLAICIPNQAFATGNSYFCINPAMYYHHVIDRTDTARYYDNKDYIYDIRIVPYADDHIVNVKFNSYSGGLFSSLDCKITLCIADENDKIIARFEDDCWCYRNDEHEISFRDDALVNPDTPISEDEDKEAISKFCKDIVDSDGSHYKAFVQKVYVED